MTWMLLIGAGVFCYVIYKKHFAVEGGAGDDTKEEFRSERKKNRKVRRVGGTGMSRRERFQTEGRDDDDEDDAGTAERDENDEIDRVYTTYKRLNDGIAPSPDQVRSVMREMRKSGDSASDVIKRVVGRDSIAMREEEMMAAARDDVARTPPPAMKQDIRLDQAQGARYSGGGAPDQRPQPAMDAMDASMLRRVEDELESVVNRIDGLLEEISAMKGRQVSGPLSDNATIESFVPYHPV